MHRENLKVCPVCRRHYDDARSVCPNDGATITEIHGQAPEYGTMIDQRYVCFDIIGSGGMSHVFRAYDKKLHRPVALKVIKPRYAQQTAGVQRFFEEVRAIDRLHHPNIVELTGFGQSAEGILYLAMDLLDGDNLENIIRAEKRLPPRMAVTIARQVTMALRSAHRAGVLHRDLKPENIFILPQQKAKLLDFGIATLLENGASPTQESSTVCGTPEYMSPEQIRGQSSGPASDLYGLGVLLFEMLTGNTPFQGDTPVEIVSRHLDTPVPDLHALASPEDGYKEIRTLTMALLNKDPDQRPPVEEVLHILSQKMDLEDGAFWSDETTPGLHERPTLILTGEKDTLTAPHSPGRETNLEPFLICGICHCLNEVQTTECVKCGNEMSGVPIPRGNQMSTGWLGKTNRETPIHRKVSLLHIELEPEVDAPADWRDRIQAEIDLWTQELKATEGVICHSSENAIRVVFGLFEPVEPASIAIKEATRLQQGLRSITTSYARFAMAISTDSVFMEQMGFASPDWALQGAKVNIVTRMVKMAAPSTLLIDEKTLAESRSNVNHRNAGSILPRGAEEREPLHTVHA